MKDEIICCEKCKSTNIVISQTISAGAVAVICSDCDYVKVLNKKLHDAMEENYYNYLNRKNKQEIQEEQGIVEVYV